MFVSISKYSSLKEPLLGYNFSDSSLPRCSLFLKPLLSVCEDMTLHRCFLHVITGSKTILESDHLRRSHMCRVCVHGVYFSPSVRTDGTTSRFQVSRYNFVSGRFPNTSTRKHQLCFSSSEIKVINNQRRNTPLCPRPLSRTHACSPFAVQMCAGCAAQWQRLAD